MFNRRKRHCGECSITKGSHHDSRDAKFCYIAGIPVVRWSPYSDRCRVSVLCCPKVRIQDNVSISFDMLSYWIVECSGYAGIRYDEDIIIANSRRCNCCSSARETSIQSMVSVRSVGVRSLYTARRDYIPKCICLLGFNANVLESSEYIQCISLSYND